MSRAVARELRGTRLVTGGPGVIVFATRGGRLLSGGACAALERAAWRLGYRAPRGKCRSGLDWVAVVRAVDDYRLDEVLSEAIEEQEAEPLAPAGQGPTQTRGALADAPEGPPGPGKGQGP